MKITLRFAILIAGILLPLFLCGQENQPRIKIGGLFMLAGYYDTYDSVDSREGVSYSYPKAPVFDEFGNDLNKVGQFGMSAYETRLQLEATGFKVLDADARIFVQSDFMGASGTTFKMVRLRHAYMNLRWKKDELLLGQSNTLSMPEEVTAGVLTAGGGSPISVLSRPILIRYGRHLSDRWKAYGAVSYYHVQAGDPENATTYNAARNNGFPSLEARIQYDNSGGLFFGAAGSYKSLQPRTITDAGRKTTQRIGSANVTGFLRYRTDRGFQIKMQGVYGTNLTHLGMPGGYAKEYSGSQEIDDFSYTNLKGVSAWIDLESKSYRHFYFGIYAGYLQSLGTGKEVDPEHIYARDAGLHYTGRIGPRVTYRRNNLTLGIECSLFFSRWGEAFDNHYKPTESYGTTYNNRITLAVRYAF